MDFDTGSSDLFLPYAPRTLFLLLPMTTGIDSGTDCGTTCRGHTLYSPGASSTNTRQSFSLAFGDGSTVQGTLFTDTVTVAGLTVSEWGRV